MAHNWRVILAAIFKSNEFGPSDKAWSGSGCASKNTPAIPSAVAALASTGANRRLPPVAEPNAPGF